MKSQRIDARTLLSLIPCSEGDVARRVAGNPSLGIKYMAGRVVQALTGAREQVIESALASPRLGDAWVRHLRKEIELLHGARISDQQMTGLISSQLAAAISRGMPLEVRISDYEIQVCCGIATIGRVEVVGRANSFDRKIA